MPTIAMLLLVVAQAGDRPVPTKDGAAKMTVPKGFNVTLFAGEPAVVQPIAFTFDDRGRMWVVECLSYPKWSRDGKGSDRVIILEDTDGDGVHDKRTVFLDNGVNLSGIEWGFGGVWLCSLPNLVFIPVKDDKPAGKPEVVLDGWNMIDTKHNIFNSLGWGPDGWLYGCNGIQAKSWVGAPGTPKEKRTYLDCGVWRYHPTRKAFEAVAHGTTNPFGLDWDENGEMFVTNCVIDHLFHFVPGGHYERMYGQDANPHTYGLMKSCVDYKHWAGGDWTSSRSTGTGGDPKHSDFGGGHAHSGCAIYLGDNFPAEYRNTLFTANIHGNRLNNDGLERTKSGMKGVRRPDFLFANDSWFRGICVKVGPEGGLYVSDWCDTGECHNYDKADTSNGRIYRVVYGKPKAWKGDISTMSDAELVKMAVFDKNEWFVRKARRVLQERAAAGKLSKNPNEGLLPEWEVELRGVFKNNKPVPQQLRAMWALHAVGRLDEKRLYELADPERQNPASREKEYDHIRAWAVRLGAETAPGPVIAGMMKSLAVGDESPFVLIAVASAVQRLDPHGGREVVAALAEQGRGQDNDDLRMMVWYATLAQVAKEPRDANEVQRLLKISTTPWVSRNLVRHIVSTAAPADRKERLRDILDCFTLKDAQRAALLAGLQDALEGVKNVPEPEDWAGRYNLLSRSKSPEVRARADAVAILFGNAEAIKNLSARIADTTAKADDRRTAIELLLTRKQPDFAKTLRGLLDDPAVRQVAVRGLAAFADAETPAAILKAYPKFTADEKLDAVQTLAARKEWANKLLDAVENKEIPRADVPLVTARQILALNDKALSTRLEAVWGKVGTASKEKVALAKKWKAELTDSVLAKADVARGRALFAKHCGACHKMFGEGGDVGPELTGSQRANLDYVLENVLDPSAVVPREFKMINFSTTDERVVSGIVLRETPDAVTVRTTNETLVLPVADIAARKPTNVSIMPDGLFDQMKPDEVRDLVAYLRAKEQPK